jgi:hypothetical protein
MKVQSIDVYLRNGGGIGTTAFVQGSVVHALLWPITESHVYECHRADPGKEAEWIREGTGLAASDGLSKKINYAVQAAIRTRRT